MIDILRQVLLAVHIFLAIIWVGGVLFMGWAVYPSAKTLSLKVQQPFFLTLMQRTHKIFMAAGSGVILTGVLLGTVVGPIQSWHDIWYTRFGVLWFLAFMIAVLTLFWGGFVSYKKSIRLFADALFWKHAESVNPEVISESLIDIAVTEAVEVAGFMALIVIMVLL